MRKFLILAPALLLAACADPYKRCVSDATEDLKIVRTLIADTRQNIDRGYAINTETRTIAYTDFCFGSGYRHGGIRFCNRLEPVSRDVPVAIDPRQERRKLAELQTKEKELQRETAAALDFCERSRIPGATG
ncbi:hypothetical protein [Litoreibacter roseus]|uniref:Lipoprotein n=1 Tax=Litoreibacter roseus TaxID=2601869 RepID=A0A6N6JI44_9RHOB|nr:hypothetical protein [Litoreibacter roseus]GFE64882.1 hypothetical protein KIN_19560 [Litoreibacter roseus]